LQRLLDLKLGKLEAAVLLLQARSGTINRAAGRLHAAERMDLRLESGLAAVYLLPELKSFWTTKRCAMDCKSIGTRPGIEEKIRILHLMESLGIDSVNIGLPGAGPRAAEHVEALARRNRRQSNEDPAKLRGTTVENDIRPIAEIHSESGLPSKRRHFSAPVRFDGLVEDDPCNGIFGHVITADCGLPANSRRSGRSLQVIDGPVFHQPSNRTGAEKCRRFDGNPDSLWKSLQSNECHFHVVPEVADLHSIGGISAPGLPRAPPRAAGPRQADISPNRCRPIPSDARCGFFLRCRGRVPMDFAIHRGNVSSSKRILVPAGINGARPDPIVNPFFCCMSLPAAPVEFNRSRLRQKLLQLQVLP